MEKKILKFSMGGLGIEAKVHPDDEEWVRLLFTTHKEPFKVLHDIGYVLVEDNEKP